MAHDQRLVDQHQVELARRLCESSIGYMERQLGVSALRPPGGQVLIRRLAALHRQLRDLEGILRALSMPPQSSDRTAAD